MSDFESGYIIVYLCVNKDCICKSAWQMHSQMTLQYAK